MTQNNEREAFELLISIEYEHPTDLTRDGDGYSDGYVDNAWWGWCKALHYSKAPISQNEQQEAVAWQFYQDGDWWNGSPHNNHKQNTIDAGIPIRELYTSPPKQIPDGWKLVPIEPTPKMVDATWNDDELIKNMSHNRRNKHIYKAMISESPTNTEVGK